MAIWLKLIEAVAEGDPAKVMQLCRDHPCLTTRCDGAGNSLLHYLAAQRNPQFINAVLDKVEFDKTPKNHQGATPYDLWHGYERATTGFQKKLRDAVETLAESVMVGDTELIHEGLERGLSPRLYFFDDDSLTTLLHLGTLYGQPDSIKAVLEHVDDALFSELLTIQDSEGLTPLELAEAASQEWDDGAEEASEIVRLLTERQRLVAAKRDLQASTPPLPTRCSLTLLKDYREQLIAFDKKLKKGIAEKEFPSVRAELPALCALSSAICRQAAQQPYSEKQALFLAEMAGEGASQLQENLRLIAEFLETCLQENRVQALFEFTSDPALAEPSHSAICKQALGKIYLNAAYRRKWKIDLLEFVQIIIHEVSHLPSCGLSLDLCFSTRRWKTRAGEKFSRNEGKIVLDKCIRLCKEAQYEPNEYLKEERIAVTELARRLQPDSRQHPPGLSLGCYFASRNAETYAATSVGLAAMAVNLGETETETMVVMKENGEQERKEHRLLSIFPEFLSKNGIEELLVRYGTVVHDHCYETPPPLSATPSSVPSVKADETQQGTSPTKDESVQTVVISGLTQAIASTSDTPSLLGPVNANLLASESLATILVASNTPN